MLTLDLTVERIGVFQCSKCMCETEMTLHASKLGDLASHCDFVKLIDDRRDRQTIGPRNDHPEYGNLISSRPSEQRATRRQKRECKCEAGNIGSNYSRRGDHHMRLGWVGALTCKPRSSACACASSSLRIRTNNFSYSD